MKKYSLKQNNNIFYIFFIVLAIGIVFAGETWIEKVRQTHSNARIVTSHGLKTLRTSFLHTKPKSELIGNIKELEAKVSSLEERVSLLQTYTDNDIYGIEAFMLSQPPYSRSFTFLLDKGAINGIEKDMHVYSSEGGIIGVIYQTFLHQSLGISFVSHLSHNMFSINGTLVNGEGRGGDVVIYVQHGISVNIDDLVYIVADEALPFGEVAFIDNEPTNPFQQVYVRPYTNIFTTSLVLVK